MRITAAAPPAISRPSSSTVARRRVELADDRALVHDRDPVGEREDLVEVLGDQQHADAVGGRLAQVRVHRLDRGDVEAARRRRGDEHARARRRELAREHDLLQVAAGELPRRQLRAAAADVVALDQLRGVLADRAAGGAAGRGRASRPR